MKWYLIGIKTETVYCKADYQADLNKFMMDKWHNRRPGKQSNSIILPSSLPEPMIIRKLSNVETINLSRVRKTLWNGNQNLDNFFKVSFLMSCYLIILLVFLDKSQEIDNSMYCDI